MGWYGTGANANHRYLFKLTKGGASLYSDKMPLNKNKNEYVENDLTVGGDGTFGGALTGTSINTGDGDFEIGQNLRATDNVSFNLVGTDAGDDFAGASITESSLFTALSAIIGVNIRAHRIFLGYITSGGVVHTTLYCLRSATNITIYTITPTGPSTIVLTSGGGASFGAYRFVEFGISAE